MALGHAELRQQKGHRLRCHRRAAVRVQGQPAPRDLLALDGLLNEPLGQLGRFPIRQHPAHHVAAENVEDHVEVKVSPLGRSQQLGDVPRPDLFYPCAIFSPSFPVPTFDSSLALYTKLLAVYCLIHIGREGGSFLTANPRKSIVRTSAGYRRLSPSFIRLYPDE